jgi:hypothetical protein
LQFVGLLHIDCMQVNRTLTIVNLRNNFTGAEGAAFIAEALKARGAAVAACVLGNGYAGESHTDLPQRR